MQRPSLLSPPAPPPLPLLHGHLRASLRIPFATPAPSSLRPSHAVLPLPAAASPATPPAPNLSKDDAFSEFIEIGYISTVHGLQGELRVKPTTDFPELRFTKAGRRWIRSRVLGKDVVSPVELKGGRPHHGQKSWILSFDGIDNVDDAKRIVGSTLLVKEDDRPELEEGEFYTPDLVGMRVVLKESGKLVGTVASIVNYGSNDLLQVMLDSTEEKHDESNSSDLKIGASPQYVWVPFVEAIVPVVDMDKREMWITPPKGLLELNLRSDMRSKKERRQLEWKQRKQQQRRLLSAKRRLSEIGHKHVLEGFKIGEKDQKSLLANQIMEINFKLFKHALESISKPSARYDLLEFINCNSAISLKNASRISERPLIHCASETDNDMNRELHKEGLQLLAKSKVAIVIVMDDVNIRRDSEATNVCSEISQSRVSQLQEVLLLCKRFLKVAEEGISVPIIVVSPSHELRVFEEYMSDNDYLGFDSQKVWLMEEEKLPIVSISTDQNNSKILLKSPWEIIQSPAGPGGIFSLLSSHNVIDSLSEMGIEYVQICSLGGRSAAGQPLYFGFISSCRAEVGIKIFKDLREDEFDLVFSMKYLQKICKQLDELQFNAIEDQHEHVELVDKEWITVHPNRPSSHRLYLPIYSFLNTCSFDDVCTMQILD